jgi:hypothetical protein
MGNKYDIDGGKGKQRDVKLDLIKKRRINLGRES